MIDEYVLGVDGGGTKTDVICSDLSGATIGQGLSGPTNLTSTSVGAASFNLIEAVRQAVETLSPGEFTITRLVMGLAGADTADEIDRSLSIFKRSLLHYPIQEYVLVNDSVIALENGTDSANAVVLIAGTGSISYGRNADGQTYKTGGMDFLLTDQGSGYYIGRQVLREAVKSFDGRREKTVLEDLVCQHFNIASIAELKNEVYNPLLSKIEIADLAHLCSVAFAENDAAAVMIFEHATKELLLHAATVINNLGMAQSEFELVLSGAVTRLPYMQEQLIDQLHSRYPQVTISLPDTPPVYGAIKLALSN